jgi:hypothetical protein
MGNTGFYKHEKRQKELAKQKKKQQKLARKRQRAEVRSPDSEGEASDPNEDDQGEKMP